MMDFDKYNKNIYFRVKKFTDISGRECYKVQSATSWHDILFNAWNDYSWENESLEEAIDQIKTIHSYKLKSEEIVYKEKIKKGPIMDKCSRCVSSG